MSVHGVRSDMAARARIAAHRVVYRKIMARLLENVHCGSLTFILPSGEHVHGAGVLPGPQATIELHRWRMLRRLALRGDLGFAESWMDGDWTTSDLTAVIEFADRNYRALLRYVYGFRAMRAFSQLRHVLRANSRSGSRRNIEFHYDLGNDFYSLWLDPTMTYSSAIYEGAAMTLEQAQQGKIARIADLLEIEPDHAVLEIGCGWGAMAKAIAERGAALVTGLTLSPSQAAIARERVANAGVANRVEIRLQDYRDVSECFDRIVSVEMIEAVGEDYWPAYFTAIHDRLNPGGHAIVQAITISPDRFEGYRTSVDFIQRYIFPGGMLPTPQIIRDQAGKAGLDYTCEQTFGLSYARTLQDWARRFNACWPQIAAQGFDERFRRMWNYYLAYCEAGFRTGTIDVGLYRLTRRA